MCVCAQLSPTLGPHAHQVRPFVHGDSPGKNTGMDNHSLSPGDLPNPGVELTFLALASRFLTTVPRGKPR